MPELTHPGPAITAVWGLKQSHSHKAGVPGEPQAGRGGSGCGQGATPDICLSLPLPPAASSGSHRSVPVIPQKRKSTGRTQGEGRSVIRTSDQEQGGQDKGSPNSMPSCGPLLVRKQPRSLMHKHTPFSAKGSHLLCLWASPTPLGLSFLLCKGDSTTHLTGLLRA